MGLEEGRAGRLLWPWLLLCCSLPGLYCGFACLSNPCIYGICIDDVNSTFSCYCIDGYTGVLCQTNWDECWSGPCQNGGECLDGVAAFNCTCPSGFGGDYCEMNVNECESNPCYNNGTCLDGADAYSCVCPAGYSGPFCEHDVSVCNVTEDTRCENGGLCVEGPGIQFSCLCTTGWEGELCEMAVDECASSPCRNGAVCLDHHANYSCACPFGYSGRNCEVVLEICGANNPCENGALCLIEDSMSICYCVPDYHGDRCQLQYDECLLGPGCKNGGTCIDGVDEFTCSCPPDFTGDYCECFIFDEDNINCSYIAPDDTYKYEPTWATSKVSTTPMYMPTTTTGGTALDTDTTYSFEPFANDTSVTSWPTTTGLHESYPEYSSTLSFSSQPSTEHSEETSTVDDSNAVTIEDRERQDDLPQSPSTSSTAESSVISEITTQHSFTIFDPQRPETTPFMEDITVDILRTTSELFFPTHAPDYTESTDHTPTCRKIPCLNGGLCLNTSDGLKCVCKAGWEGVQCGDRESVRVAAFSGQSYVAHKGSNSTHTTVEITARTVGIAGLMFYARIDPGIYLALYLEAGLLKFKFSCGLQTMLLSEVQFHVNNGYDLVATVGLEFLPKLGRSRHCLATVRVNNTLAMSGEQVAAEPVEAASTSALYLGGVPPALDLDLPVLDGFVGCMQNLVVDAQPRNILGDAVESWDIKECLSLACLSGPCLNGATCLDINNAWSCLCANGFLGEHCEKSVCDNNPCEYGGTCVGFPGSGFLCLCPLGKHGQFCEYDLDIGQPVYSSSVGGLSSYSAHMLPTDIHQNMILSFKFIPHDMEQISLMAFLGQDGAHGHGSDHLAVSFIKGYIVLTWNLGSGPRRIFTSRPVEDLGHQPHVVQVGRVGQTAWLFVDTLGNVTGKSPGALSELNTRPILYLGGHDSGNFSLLPHDLPLHTGFSGCLYDARLQTGHMVMMVQQTKATTGRSVGQCGTTLCHEYACQNGAGCIHHGATFTCLCADGWAGPTCGMKFNPCDFSQHNCSSSATCVPQRDGYVCDCPVGRTGRYCEIEEMLSDIRLTGIRSYLGLAAEGLYQHRSCLDLEVMPTANHGLLLYSGRSDNQQYISLSLQGGVLELRVSAGRHRRRGDPVVVRSRRLMALGRWHRVRAARYGRRLFLWVEGTVNSATLLPGESLPGPSYLVYIGGVPDLSTLPPGSTSGPVTSFQGCVRRFASQWKWIPMNNSSIVAGRNIADCDGTACGGDVCYHGSCSLHANQPRCKCPPEYMGTNCETQASCRLIGCKNGGKCVDDKGSSRCSCPLGKTGAFCETDSSHETASFGGDSYIVIDRTPAQLPMGRDSALLNFDVDFIYLNFSTAHPEGLLLWTGRPGGRQFLGVGVKDSLIKVVWCLDGETPVVTTVPGRAGGMADGTWHDVAISLHTGNVSIIADHTPAPVTASARALSTDGRFYIGGFPSGLSVKHGTHGHFESSFRGCLQKIAWSVESIVSNFSGYQGENVDVCDPFEP